MQQNAQLTKEQLRRLEDSFIDVDEDGYENCSMCRCEIEGSYRYCPECGRRLIER